MKTSYISLLRGINVGGQKLIKMTELQALYESLKFAAVNTYIQSGNVVFKSKSNAQKLELQIKTAIKREFGFDVIVIIREQDELKGIIDKNPFIAIPKIDVSRLYVTFLESTPDGKLAKELPLDKKNKDEFKILGREIYLHCPSGYGKTVLSNTFFERRLKVTGTTRNWNTVNALYLMSKEK
jgi:uncharacterized protein (DUF1697 family)